MILDRLLGLGPQAALWIELLIASVLIVLAGTKLSRYGDVLGEKTGLGNAWLGFILLSAVTSLPELVTCVGTAGWVREPDLSMGNLLGSNCFNLLIIVLLDVLQGPTALLAEVKRRHIVPAGFGILLTVVVVAPIVVGDNVAIPLAKWGWMASTLVVVLYVLAVRSIFIAEGQAARDEPDGGPNQYDHLSLGSVIGRFAAAGAVILVAGLWLSWLADEVASRPLPFTSITLGKTFVGSLLLAMVTSLPEVVVTVAAFRMGALDMAMGNLLGSNLFNLAMVPFCHVLYWGDIYTAVKPTHGLTALMGIFMIGLVIVGIGARSRKTILHMNYEVMGILACYVVGQYAIFQLR
jgi:cation:H+ antiporter